MPGLEAFEHIRSRRIPDGDWRYTDDTEMALSIVDMLAEQGTIERESLARTFAARMDPMRGYGEGAYHVLKAIESGTSWQRASRGAFGGKGSFGNGAAMRVAPLGAFFADDLDRCIAEARASAEVTHAHPEGIAGAIAVAVAAALTWQNRSAPLPSQVFLQSVVEVTPAGYVREAIEDAAALPSDSSIVTAASTLGNGNGVTAPDTVPLCLWITSQPRSFEDHLWLTVSALGDRDTTCAIVGGIVGLATGVPRELIERREPLPRAS